MSQLIESIKIYNGRVYNIKLHNQRCNYSRKQLFGTIDLLDLRKAIIVPEVFKQGLVKCRIIYKEVVLSVDFSNYTTRSIQKIKVVQDDSINYQHKFEDRSDLSKIKDSYSSFDEILIIRNGLLTDAYYYNVVIEKNGKYFTPQQPLLQGVMRSYLLKKEVIIPKNILIQDLQRADKVYLINALTPIGKIELNTSQIQF